MATMRAKMAVGSVTINPDWQDTTKTSSETLTFVAVSKSTPYPEDGSDENNSYAKWSPSASLTINIANPNLWGKFVVGDTFYVDFSPAPK